MSRSDRLSNQGFGDTAPEQRASESRARSLCLTRTLLNAGDLIEWAKAVGFETTLPPAAMHTTIAFSRRPFDWSLLDTADSDAAKNPLPVAATERRAIEALGADGAIVLRFDSSRLRRRHYDIIALGASWEWPGFLPHVTISWRRPTFEFGAIAPYSGPLIFGPERASEIVDGWETLVEER